MRDQTIVVNDIAARSGGPLTILKHFFEELLDHTEAKKYQWIVFVSSDELLKYNHVENITVIKIKANNWLKRIYWDTFGLRNWLKKNDIDDFKICSLQNTGMPFIREKQYIYIHQALIFKRNIALKWFEWKIFLYRFIYYYSIKWTINKNSFLIVQTNWMKDALIQQFKVSEKRVMVITPEIPDKEILAPKNPNEYSYELFYPAVPYGSYKNHELLIKTLFELQKIDDDFFSKIKLIFTSKPDFNRLTQYYQSMSKKFNVSKNIEWVGYLNQADLERYYQQCDLFLFPSRVESFGLPLVEAAYRRKIIFTLDTCFSKELLTNYSGTTFLKNNAKEWADSIYKFYTDKMKRIDLPGKYNLKVQNQNSLIDILTKK